ncbi:MAG TPA: hypothetical protein VM529_16190, partial [Gemmata sp.]|nr:hypothetical protein [Gemmata sp.]
PEPLGPIPLLASYQEDLSWLRRAVVAGSPEWFGVKAVRFSPDETRLGPVQVELFMVLPFTQQVTEWDLSGNIEEGPAVAVPATGTYALIEMNAYPVTTTAGVEALAKHRGTRRITSLDLRNNNLDNDAARALVRSPYLHNLKRLRLLEGNRLRGRVWQQVIERFGEDVVG